MIHSSTLVKYQNHHRHPRLLVFETDHSRLVGTGVERIVTSTYNDCTISRGFLLSLLGLHL